jgi:uncharacterized protein YciI
MFVVLLKFAENKANAGQFMDGHNAWLRNGFEKGVFQLAGTLQPKHGGAILAHNVALAALQEIVGKDPFVAEKVVSAEIIEIIPSKSSPELRFLMG